MTKRMTAWALLFVLLAQPALATIYHIRTDGNNANAGTTDSAGGAWRTMGKCATTAVAGDTCIVGNGTYVEGAITFSTSGSAGNYITLQAQNKHLAILSSTSGCSANIVIQASYIHIKDLRTKEDATNVRCGSVNATTFTGIRMFEGSPLPSISNSGNTTNHHAWIEGTLHDASSARGHSIKVGGDDGLIEGNIAYNGIEGSMGQNYIMRNNKVLGPDGFGGGLIGGKFGNRNYQVYNNYVKCTINWQTCFTIGGLSGEGNHYDASTDIESYNAVAYNNVVEVAAGITGTPLIGLRGCKDCLWAYNTMIGAIAPLTLYVGGGTSAPAPADPTFKFNIIYTSGGACTSNFSTYTGTRTVDYNLFQGCSSPPSQTHALSGNPLLGGDYTLSTGSPAIDAIPAADAITTWPKYGGGTMSLDLITAPTWQSATYSARPDNTDYDVGAYEFYTPDGQGAGGGQSQDPTATSPRRHPLGWWR
ncbi:MAG TPA: hypothetical protein PKN47_01600 [Nitrospira sp.]|nr:hypothetical protein [Nitrospira sp.]